MKQLSINQALDQLETLAGKDVIVRGILAFEFENVALYHSPTSERRSTYESSIWVSVGSGSLGFDKKTCERWHGKVVVVEGVLFKPDPFFGGCGHMSLWPAQILARTIQRDK